MVFSIIAATTGSISLFMLFYLNRKKLIGDIAKNRSVKLQKKLRTICENIRKKRISEILCGNLNKNANRDQKEKILGIFNTKDLEVLETSSTAPTYYDFTNHAKTKRKYIKLINKINRNNSLKNRYPMTT